MILDKNKLAGLLDISAPFLMLDELIDLEPGVYSHCTKSVSIDDWYMKAHLPSIGMMPGTLLTEAMLQATVLILYLKEGFGKNPAYVNKFDIKLLANVSPPETLQIFSFIDSLRRGVARGHAEIKSKEGVICKGTFVYVCPHLFPRLPGGRR